jgi:hypothetical protein
LLFLVEAFVLDGELARAAAAATFFLYAVSVGESGGVPASDWGRFAAVLILEPIFRKCLIDFDGCDGRRPNFDVGDKELHFSEQLL